MDKLKKAEQLAPKVTGHVRRMRASRGLAQSLDQVLGAGLDITTRRLITENSTALIQRLHTIAPDAVENRSSVHGHAPGPRLEVGDSPGCDLRGLLHIPLDLDAAGRAATSVFEVALDLPLDDFLDEVLEQVLAETESLISGALPSGDSWGTDTEIAGQLSMGLRRLSRRSDDAIFCTLEVDFYGCYGRSGMVFDSDGKVRNETKSAAGYLEGQIPIEALLSLELGSPRFYEVDTSHLWINTY